MDQPSATAVASVLIVEDHPIFREALKSILLQAFDVVAEAADGAEGIEKALTHRPDVILMDVQMPGMNGVAAARELKAKLPDTNIVILSNSDDDETIFAAVDAGVSGYISKHEYAATVLQAVDLAARGQACLPPRIAKRLLAGLVTRRTRPENAFDSLTARELQILGLVASGKRNRDIARLLRISERTVANHIAKLYRKIGVFDRTQATAFAIKHGVVGIGDVP